MSTDEATRFDDTYRQWGIFSEYAKGKRVVEFGVRIGGSTRAFLRSSPKSLLSVEKVPLVGIEAELLGIANDAGVPWEFVVGDSLEIPMVDCDVLFIDTLHIYEQLLGELRRHSGGVRDYILVHDIQVFGGVGEQGNSPGLRQAVYDFLDGNAEWELIEENEIWPGLAILGRKSNALVMSDVPEA